MGAAVLNVKSSDSGLSLVMSDWVASEGEERNFKLIPLKENEGDLNNGRFRNYRLCNVHKHVLSLNVKNLANNLNLNSEQTVEYIITDISSTVNCSWDIIVSVREPWKFLFESESDAAMFTLKYGNYSDR